MQSSAHAAVIPAADYLPAAERAATLERFEALVARQDVRERLVGLGVDPQQALARAAAMTDAEVAVLAERLDAMPAGGDALAVIGIVFVVLIILELVGAIDLFKRV
jgi:hypothetical protein